jgi:peptidoglycan/xylan/chitin deacetylase (PgdA/CDA1 family)
MTKVLLTVDTELLWRHYAAGASWQENLERSYDAAGVGVPYQLRTLRAHGLKACFFVDPMPALVYGLDPVKRMVGPILEAGQEVQLHLHPLWATVEEPAEDCKFELTDFGLEEQRDLIARARDLLVQAGAPEPIAFRSGSYAADADTLAALADLGFRYDSSHNGSHHPWPSALPLDPALIDPKEAFGIVEVPVTQIATAGGGLRHFQLCALSVGEMQAALNHAAAHRHPVLTIVSHSFELASRDGLRANGVIKRRFDQLCGFLAANRERVPTAHFTELEGAVEAVASTPLPARRWREARRMAEQAWGNARYEKAGSLNQLRALASSRT